MKPQNPYTEISTFDEAGITIRGKDLVRDLIGEVNFTQMIYFHILGRMPTPGQMRVLDAVLVTLVDHGVLATVGARMVYMSSPEAIQAAIATGIMGLGSQFGGVMEITGQHLETIMNATDGAQAAADIVASYRADKKPVPGFGHPHHKPEDPRTPKLLAVADQEGVAGAHVQALHTLAAAVDAAMGKHITINATAAMAALLGDIGVPGSIMRGFAAISRTPGIVGHLLEEQRHPAAYSIGMKAQELVPYTGSMPVQN
ncbi:MAG: citryl-CoA lyase [Betaproteobacteria bacterium]|nr:citryl-CoA lyase [Betaproteobacteria bacterium]